MSKVTTVTIYEEELWELLINKRMFINTMLLEMANDPMMRAKYFKYQDEVLKVLEKKNIINNPKEDKKNFEFKQENNSSFKLD
ncbi:hypothetical protein [Campylobacter canadensis]|uniref:hypothetical protein n=1 Tax=Campylobacter canadensis TaxID=449520 RepID=UPI001CC9AF49|nr:hypothetical protein [Campylobacter canadensis]MBZ8002651.1 hypothetical protein [Campylobacter canadensis]